MQIKNNEDYMAISIDELGLSTRTFNCLMRAGLNTLYLLVDNYEALPKLRNIGAKSITEIDELLARIDQDGISVISCGETQLTRSDSVTESVEQSVSLPEDILSRPASDLHISIRILHSFQNEGIETIAQALVLTPEAIRHMRNMGTLSAQQLQEQLDLSTQTMSLGNGLLALLSCPLALFSSSVVPAKVLDMSLIGLLGSHAHP